MLQKIYDFFENSIGDQFNTPSPLEIWGAIVGLAFGALAGCYLGWLIGGVGGVIVLAPIGVVVMVPVCSMVAAMAPAVGEALVATAVVGATLAVLAALGWGIYSLWGLGR